MIEAKSASSNSSIDGLSELGSQHDASRPVIKMESRIPPPEVVTCQSTTSLAAALAKLPKNLP